MGLDFDKWLGGDYSWTGAPPASEDDLEALLAWTPAELPRNFLNLLRRSDGGHARLAAGGSARIWSAREVIARNQEPRPGFISFADVDGAGSVAFDTRHDFPYGVYTEAGESVSRCFGSFFTLARVAL